MYNFEQFPQRKNTSSLKWERYREQDILPMWVADMDFTCAPEIIAAMQQRLEHEIVGYTVASPDLAQATIDHLEQMLGWSVDAEWLVWLPGVVPGMSAACRAFLEIGESVMTLTPVYHHFLHIAQDQGFGLKRVPLSRDASLRYNIDFDAMKAAVDEGTKVLFLSNPHNPVGRSWSEQELVALCDFALSHDMMVVSDEIHYGLILDQSKKHIPTAVAAPHCQDRLISLYSPSKTWNIAGANAAYAVIPNPTLRARFARMIRGVTGDVPTLSYVASEAAMRFGQPWLQALLGQLRANYRQLEHWVAAHPPLRMTPLEATYLAWIDVSKMQLNNPIEYFESFGVGLSSGAEFGDADFIRLNFACPTSQMDEALSRMDKAMKSWSRHEHNGQSPA